jgi:hypothetical protein
MAILKILFEFFLKKRIFDKILHFGKTNCPKKKNDILEIG